MIHLDLKYGNHEPKLSISVRPSQRKKCEYSRCQPIIHFFDYISGTGSLRHNPFTLGQFPYGIRCTTLLPPFFSKIKSFIAKKCLQMYYSKYCPSLATTFSHLSGNFRIPARKKESSFDAIHEAIHFSNSSKD